MDSNHDNGNELRLSKINNLLCVFKMVNDYDKFTIQTLIASINNYSNNYFILTIWNDGSIRLQVDNTLHVITVENKNANRLIKFIQKFNNTKTGNQ